MSYNVAVVATIAPTKRGLKDLLTRKVVSIATVATIAPTKRGLKAPPCNG